MIEFKRDETNTLQIGQEAYISLKQHLSVGIKSIAKSNDESIIEIIKTRFSYNNPILPRKKGGDAGQRVFVFKAHKTGSTAITVKKIFRGQLQEEYSIKVIVKNN